MGRRHHALLVAIVVSAVAVTARGFAQSADTSTASAQALVSEMRARHLDAIAARDPTDAERFDAAMLVDGGPLLVVSATSPSQAAIAQRIAAGSYRDAYLDLQGTPTPKGKFFVQDTGADGIRDAHEGAVDVVYEDGTRQTIFDRALAKNLRGDAYDMALLAADRRYAHILVVLADAARALPMPATAQ